MAFARRRGRPRKPVRLPANRDTGTPELARKHAAGLTGEPLDLCLKKGLISESQHWAAIHFRWLYTIRYGLPTVRSIDPADLGGRTLRQENEQWKQKREQEFAEASFLLKSQNVFPLILDFCIYGKPPAFLTRQSVSPRASRELQALREGLDALLKLWGRR